jgi:hypothetical protein
MPRSEETKLAPGGSFKMDLCSVTPGCDLSQLHDACALAFSLLWPLPAICCAACSQAWGCNVGRSPPHTQRVSLKSQAGKQGIKSHLICHSQHSLFCGLMLGKHFLSCKKRYLFTSQKQLRQEGVYNHLMVSLSRVIPPV